MKYKFKRLMKRKINSVVFWIEYNLFYKYLKNNSQNNQVLILVISFPRSGSSLIGDTLGLAENARYLREPITQNWTLRSDKVIFEPTDLKKDLIYHQLSELVFSDTHGNCSSILKNRIQLNLKQNDQNKLIIKEVNPLAIKYYIKTYNPYVIFLVRNPVPVARSFYELGCNRSHFNDRFRKETLSENGWDLDVYKESFWQGNGAFQAACHQFAWQELEHYEKRTIIKYEDICTRPMEIF